MLRIYISRYYRQIGWRRRYIYASHKFAPLRDIYGILPIPFPVRSPSLRPFTYSHLQSFHLSIETAIVPITTCTMAAPTTSTRDQVLSYLSDPRFSQELTLPATADSPALTVSYADVGFTPEPADSRSTPTMLFIPGMFGSRYISSIFDPIARKLGVRVLVADR